MRRRGTIKSRSSGSYRIRYSLGRDPVSGKRRFGTATVRGTRKDAERELTRLLRTTDTGEHVDPSRMTVRQWLDHWLAAVRVGSLTEDPRTVCRNRWVLSRASAWAAYRLRSLHQPTSKTPIAAGQQADDAMARQGAFPADA